jgi:DNA-binding NarL/FixJ family response regulator
MRVVIGEDETLLREGLRRVLTDDGFKVVAAVASAPELISAVRELHPQLVVTDIRMPPGHADDGLQAALTLRRELPDIAVVVLSQHLQRRYADELLARGSVSLGYLLKQRIGDVGVFGADLRRVAAGGTVLDPEVVELMVTRARSRNPDLSRFTVRQLEVLKLMAQGRSNEAIARHLSVSEKNVVQHVSNIYNLLGLSASSDENRRVLAVVHYLSSQP